MNEISSIITGLVGALVVLIAIPFGLGVSMHLHTRYPRIAMPLLTGLLAIVPPLGVIVTGRNLSLRNLDFTQTLDPGGLSVWLFRLTSAGSILIAVTVIIVALMKRDTTDTGGRWLLAGFFAYFAANVVLNGAFGTMPALVVAHVYALLIITAVYANRSMGLADIVAAIKWGLFLMMILGFAWVAINSAYVMQTNNSDVRLPFVNFRYWGLGDGPNSTAPLALVLLLLTIHQPFRWTILTLLSGLGALATLLLAQSMTTWLAAALVLPAFLTIRYLTHPTLGSQRRLHPMAIIAMGGLAAGLALAAAAVFLDLNEVEQGFREFVGLARGNEKAALTGRGGIWAVAIRTFLDNPLFGYGPTAWDQVFRARINMGFAFHAHNLFFQALSVGGLMGMAGLLAYLGAMGWYAIKGAVATRGLGLALFALLMFRSVSEVPLELSTILSGSFLMQVLLFHVLIAGYWESQHALTASPAPQLPPERSVGRTTTGSDPIIPPAPVRPPYPIPALGAARTTLASARPPERPARQNPADAHGRIEPRLDL